MNYGKYELSLYYGILEDFLKFDKILYINDGTPLIPDLVYNGCTQNFEFAKYMHEKYNYNSLAVNYAYFNNGHFSEKLDYKYCSLFYTKHPEMLIKYEKLHNILSFYFTINHDEINFKKLKLNKRFVFTQQYIKLGYPDYYDKNITEICDGENNPIDINNFKMRAEYPLNYYGIYSPSESLDDCYHNIDCENLFNFLTDREYYGKSFDKFEVNDILHNTLLAIYCFKNNMHIDYCVSRFMNVDAYLVMELYIKHRPFPKCYFTPFNHHVWSAYVTIDKRLSTLFKYYGLFYHFDLNYLDYPALDYLEYNCLKASNYLEYNCLKASNYLEYNCLKASNYTKYREKYKKFSEEMDIYQSFDIEKCKFLDHPKKQSI
ncbi:uncharacterized protein SPAPADRAFT_60136 [Spathaspora passalidarum NRRL Y-27907]|uniref:Uncharacterized protein n=1 Tax=Spathaspora passalidarum (strain NRRL Y-27907 / 11-Y1) TaxID=619300 RepID=G3AMD5_SPAPN|nr:uncharacterized protein SPAPADRAFT_60136 [Spathaspora passalidarum NRRL Y-27907]EGW32787.1 hypothetical protein SPAPADRAFT_60136 [Spathaspora passalidarum NRRL Y-27907]